MRTSDMIKSKFWRAADLRGIAPVKLTIAEVTEELIGRGLRQEAKCFLWFKEHLKGLQLNKTRVKVLEAAYGPDSDLWVGGRVRLSFDPTVDFGGQAVGGVRLETPPGVIYSGALADPGWGTAPAAAAPVPGRPPAPVWDEKRGQWIFPQPPAIAPRRPPPPVFNEATGQWETVNPATGEIAAPAPARAAVPNPQDATWGGAPTMSQRMAPADGGAPASTNDGWDQVAPRGHIATPDDEFGDSASDIPF